MLELATADRSAEGEALARCCLERARAVRPIVAQMAAVIEAERELPARLLDALHDAGLFRLTLPHALGGAELSPALVAQVTETIAMADASTAWCLGQALGCAMAAAYLDRDAAEAVFGARDAVLAWGAGAVGRAVVAPGGYRITGRWGFASGSRHATWLGGHCKVFDSDGRPRLTADGTQVSRTAVFVRDRADIADDWHVMGLRGTRSESYAVEDLFVEQAFTLDRDCRDECRLEAPLYRLNTTQLYACAFSGVALGIARACLDELLELARHKTPRGAPSSMRASPVVQTRLAELEAQLGSARAYQRQVLGEAWSAVSGGRVLTMAERAQLRLATTYAINQATDVVEQVYRLAGATAIFDSRPFERRFRDAHAVSQQVQGRFTNYENVGRCMLGLDVDTLFM